MGMEERIWGAIEGKMGVGVPLTVNKPKKVTER